MSETQPLTLWSGLAQSESCSNTQPQRTGVFTEGGKECGSSEPRGTSGEELWDQGATRGGGDISQGLEETKDSEVLEKSTETDVGGCHAQEKRPF